MISYNHRSNSAKNIFSKKEINNYFSKKTKNQNNSLRITRNYNLKSSATDNFYLKNNIRNLFNKLNSTTINKSKTKYDNFFIFGKRELAFQKSMEEGRKVFKYHQSTIDIEEEKSKRIRKKNTLYLTEALLKKNKTMLPLIDKDRDKLTFEINDLSLYNINKNDKNPHTCNIKKDVILLRNISLNKEKQKEMKKNKDYLISKKLQKKNDILSKYNPKENSLNNYIENLRNFCIDKYTLDVKNEKFKVINENNNNKFEIINDKVRDLTASYKLYSQNFLPKYNEYIKRILKERDLEKQKDNIFLNKIYILQKNLLSIKNKINKRQNEKDNLIRQMLLQICIKEKKINLPEYYYDILVKNMKYNELKEKYGDEITKREFEHILEYKTNLDHNEDEIIFDKIKSLENDNIELMNNYNKERINIFTLNKKKQQVEKEIKNDIINSNIENLISIKEKILENILKKYKKLSQDKSFLLKNLTTKKTKHKKLHNKIKILFENLNSYIKYDFKKNKKQKIKGEITEEMKMKETMKRLEMIIIIFLEKNRKLTKNNSEQIKNYKSMIEKKKKILKTTELKKSINMKLEEQRKKVFDKYQKIIFLQRRKMPIFNILERKMCLQKSKSQNNIKSDKLDDYLFDLKSDD